ncbi:hypothetical protein RHMOL_Rhmol09G0148800 [Rhododendron molle]|uniref:Uncharacterized protein n=1 Tax=Rhododendron molle TaxID=49168 RepID=A0ACC0MEV8_RHOML|nr:hypothetical protein RHMOL_Rhmol09G0148800 [Rhododendron molle]
MKKKKQRTAQPSPTTLASADIKYLIRKNSSFFDNLIQLIPAKFYLPTDDDSKPYFPGLNKSAKLAAKQQTRDNIKKSRRERLDPEKKPLTSTLDLLKQTLRPVPGPTEDGSDGTEPVGNPDRIPDRSVTYEELRQRLHRRIEELRGNRGGGEAWRSEKKEKRENEYRKRKRGGGGDEDDRAEGEKIDGRGGNIGKSEGEIEKEVTEASKRIEFGKVKLGGGGEERNKKKKKLSKGKELEMAKRLEEAKKDPGVAKKHSWKAAVSRAAGDKVHDDPKLLKVSMSKEKRRHEKNAEKWKDRVESREKVKGEKQQKRAGNIAERIHQKKMRKIAKREKKLMRPGFEGRKEGDHYGGQRNCVVLVLFVELIKVKGLLTDEYVTRNDLVLALPDRIEDIPDGTAATPKQTSGWSGSGSCAEIKFDSDEVGSSTPLESLTLGVASVVFIQYYDLDCCP